LLTGALCLDRVGTGRHLHLLKGNGVLSPLRHRNGGGTERRQVWLAILLVFSRIRWRVGASCSDDDIVRTEAQRGMRRLSASQRLANASTDAPRHPFDSKKLENLAGLVQPLRAVVAAGLKIKLGKTGDDPPTVSAAGLSIHSAMGLGGSTRVTEDDVRPLIPLKPHRNG
jgi:hypothetical protein